jgi:predicted nucleic acid-binding protein
MKLSERLRSVNRLFLDTAPVIYFVEENPQYLALGRLVFDRIDDGGLTAVTSPITLSECLVHPYRLQQFQAVSAFRELIVYGDNVTFFAIDDEIADNAAALRALHNLTLADALQAATALTAGCDAFLTNDSALKRVSALDVIVLDEAEGD